MDTKYIHLSWMDVEEACIKIYEEMKRDGYTPQSIVALLRGGVVPARIFSDYFDILLDFFALDVKLYDGINDRRDQPDIKEFYGDVRGKETLIVDDIWDSGKTMNAVLNYLGEEKVKTATLCWKKTAQGKPDYYAIAVEDNVWVIFPWEVREHIRGSELLPLNLQKNTKLSLLRIKRNRRCKIMI